MSKKWFGVGIVLFLITLAVVIGLRMSNEAMAVVIGVIFGVAASIPTSLIVMAVAWRRERAAASGNSPARRPAQEALPPSAASVPAPARLAMEPAAATVSRGRRPGRGCSGRGPLFVDPVLARDCNGREPWVEYKRNATTNR